MQVCNDGHDEIVFDGDICPFCDFISKNNDKISDLEEEIERLKELKFQSEKSINILKKRNQNE